MTLQTARRIALTGYFGLIILLLVWYGIMQPAYTALIILLVPLAFPFKGLIQGKHYTYAWMNFLALLYFTHGVVEAWANEFARPYALLEILASVVTYVGVVQYSRLKIRERKIRQSST